MLTYKAICVLLLSNFGTQRCKLATSSRSFTRFFSSKKYTMKILNVAEKNDAAKNIAGLLSGGNIQRREGKSVYNKIYEFNYTVWGQGCRMVMTSVSGHLLNHAFLGHYKNWTSCSPEVLFEAPVQKICNEDFQAIKKTLEQEVRSCDALIIWTDCDREGENIGFEIISVCTQIKPNLQIFRATFSEITKPSVIRAIQTLGQPNKLVSDAVEIRSELDLRIGAAFTRFQTLRLQRVFPDILSDNLISYGSCQFPTLGFVVERYKAVQSFVPESFWKIKVNHKVNELNVEFSWKRVRLFDQLFCQVLYDKCLERSLAIVKNVQTKPKSKWRPVPLDTVELEKSASRKLKINAKETMRIAERLYSQGFISYPRTETNIFPKELDLNNLVSQQTNDNRWGQFASRIMEWGSNPRQGKKSDQAHPPIHPTKHASGLQGNEAKVYEYIVRHFLACLSKDAEGLETVVEIDISDERFIAQGLQILALNYLEVFPYEKWSAKEIHRYELGQTFRPTSIDMTDGETSPPHLLTEADLISLMEKHGIGTDATHAEHIETIKNRAYVGLENDIYFVPGELGIGLVEGYDSMGFEMSKPHLRAELEADLKRISEGTRDPKVVLSEQIAKYRHVFRNAVEQANKIDMALTKYLRAEAVPVANNFQSLVNETVSIMKCNLCASNMLLKNRSGACSYISCCQYPACKRAIWFPASVLEVTVADDTCPQCGPDVRLLNFKFHPGSMAPFYPNNYTGCINGCDTHLLNMLDIDTRDRNESRISGSGDVPSLSTTSAHIIDSRNTVPSFTGNFPSARNNLPINRDNQSTFNQTHTQRNITNGWSSPRNTRLPTPSNNPRGDNNDVHCNCNLPAKRLTVLKENVNKGRLFYVCSKPQSDSGKCGFFLWADSRGTEPSASQASSSATPSSSRNNATIIPNHRLIRPTNRPTNYRAKKSDTRTPSTSRKCGLCRQEGHTRNNCPFKP